LAWLFLHLKCFSEPTDTDNASHVKLVFSRGAYAMGETAETCGVNMNKVIKLNVGGVPYATSLATLTCVPSSYFSALFSGRWEQQVMQNGEVFLDRDGEVSSSCSHLGPDRQVAPRHGLADQDTYRAHMHGLHMLMQDRC
jgi:hypothetical protein